MKELRKINSWMKRIWLEHVKKEYKNGRILEESILKSTIYFYLRKLIEESEKEELFVYSEMPFSSTKKGKGKKYHRIDIAVVTLDDDKETPAPINLLAVIELKHYDAHYNSIGLNKDLDNLKTLQNGVYYPYKPTRKLIPKKAYFIYLVDKGKISLNQNLQAKIRRLKNKGYLKIFMETGGS